jgi:hypothetical protein
MKKRRSRKVGNLKFISELPINKLRDQWFLITSIQEDPNVQWYQLYVHSLKTGEKGKIVAIYSTDKDLLENSVGYCYCANIEEVNKKRYRRTKIHAQYHLYNLTIYKYN